MSDFNKYSNYTEESSFSSVVFGSNRPLLEVELNEVQQIINSKFNKVMKALGVNILFLSDPMYSEGVLTIDSALVFEEKGGYIFEVKEASVECNENDEIYLQIEEKVVDSSTELHSYGNNASDIIANHIKDSRYPTETTKRKCITYSLMADSEVPNNTDTIKYIGVAKIEGEDIVYSDSSITESLLAQIKNTQQVVDSVQNDIRDVKTRVGRLYDVEQIYSEETLTTPTTSKEYYTYTAEKKCIINLTYNAHYSSQPPTHSRITVGDTTILEINDSSPSSHHLLTLNYVLNAGEVVKCFSAYKEESSNQIKVAGYVQYLE